MTHSSPDSDTPLQAKVQQAIMTHPFFKGSATLAFGLAGAALRAIPTAAQPVIAAPVPHAREAVEWHLIETITATQELEASAWSQIRSALDQIQRVSEDNAPASCNKVMALDFVHQVATAALAALPSSPPAAPTGDTPFGARPPASAAMGHHSAGGEAIFEECAEIALEHVGNSSGAADTSPHLDGHAYDEACHEIAEAIKTRALNRKVMDALAPAVPQAAQNALKEISDLCSHFPSNDEFARVIKLIADHAIAGIPSSPVPQSAHPIPGKRDEMHSQGCGAGETVATLSLSRPPHNGAEKADGSQS